MYLKIIVFQILVHLCFLRSKPTCIFSHSIIEIVVFLDISTFFVCLYLLFEKHGRIEDGGAVHKQYVLVFELHIIPQKACCDVSQINQGDFTVPL